MKKTAFLVSFILLFASCTTKEIKKPNKLIEEDKMINIIYDLSLLEAIKSRNPYAPENQGLKSKEFVYKKYHIDSLQYAQNNQYYALQIDRYKKMYDKVNERIQAQKKITDEQLKKSYGAQKGTPPVNDLPQVK